MRIPVDNFQRNFKIRYIFNVILTLFLLISVNTAYALDLLAPFKSLFGKEDGVVVWQASGQYIKVIEQDRGRNHRSALRNDHPAKLNPQHIAIVLASLQAWRPEDSLKSDRSVPLFTKAEVSLLSPKLADALSNSGPKQDVVFAVTDSHENFSGNRRRSTAARMFVQGNQLNLIFGDILRPIKGNGSSENISHYSKPHRAGKRSEPNGRDIIVNSGTGISHYREFERPRLDWIIIDIPAVVAAYQGSQLLAPAATMVSMQKQAGGALSSENRKLRIELARLRKQAAEARETTSAETSPQYEINKSPPTNNNASVNSMNSSLSVNSMNSNPPVNMNRNVTIPDELDSIQKRLKLLKDLHDNGLITDQEYDAKRSEIVEQI